MIAAFTLAEQERVSEQDPKSAAELALYAASTRLSAKHAAQVLLNAAQTNFDAGNFETCARFCRDSRLASDTKVTASFSLAAVLPVKPGSRFCRSLPSCQAGPVHKGLKQS